MQGSISTWHKCRGVEISMNHRIALPAMAAAVLLPALLLASEQTHLEHMQPAIPDPSRMSAVQSSDEVAFTLQERVKHSDLIIEGAVVRMASLKKQIDPANDGYWVFTIATVKVNDLLKGEAGEGTIDVQLWGGETDGVAYAFERHGIGINDDVIMFLEKNPGSIYGDNYALVGPTSGMYLIEGDSAKHYYEEMTLEAASLRDAVREAQGLN